ncbi:MAG: SGNH/GDSL hydrolase family protein [Pirellulaceae bacterium]
MRRLPSILATLILVLTSFSAALAAEPQLQPGDYVAVIGDSITEQQLYSKYIEDYLLMCQPALNLRVTQFGWGGETAPGFANRMANDMLRFDATVATTCFGMNDGRYAPMTPETGKAYRDGQLSIVSQLKKAGVRCIVVGSPGCVDADTFGGHKPEQAKMYNETLAALRDIARDVAKEEGVVFANVLDPMIDAMTKAKAKYGSQYHLAGNDGVHPDCNGHLVMAYAFLTALGCDGNIGAITVDLKQGKATASAGHKVLSSDGGKVTIESTRYPFCFFGDPAQPNSTRGVIEFLPFNEKLNRLTLTAKGGAAARYKVTWGEVAKEFTADQLAAGINLAAEFLDNPFSQPFQQVENKIAQQQAQEVNWVKNLLHNIPNYKQAVPQEDDSLEKVAKAIVAEDKKARDASAATLVPVKHTLQIEPIK